MIYLFKMNSFVSHHQVTIKIYAERFIAVLLKNQLNSHEFSYSQDIGDIIMNLTSGLWSDRRDGLSAMQRVLRSKRKLR